MKVVFLQEVPGTALPGEVKEVRDGFARNYLLPRGLAVPATKDALQRAQALAKREERRQAALDAEARRIVAQLEGKTVTIAARVGEQGRLYGSVTASDIAEKLSELLGGEFDRRRIHLPQPIREIGTRTVTLRLSRNVSFELPVEVVPEDGRRRAGDAAPAAAAPAAGASEESLAEPEES
jgi:large subunit ribosomal protein L9